MENSRGFDFWILDKSGMSVDTTGSTIKLSQKKNGNVYQTSCVAKDAKKGHYIVMFAPEALMTTGEMEIQWIITKGSDTLRTIPKTIKVYEALDFSSPSGGNLVLDWHAIEEAVAKIKDVKQDVQKVEQIKTELSDVLTTEQDRRDYHNRVKPIIDGWINNPNQFKGDQGPQGPPGPKGNDGPQGSIGNTGPSNSLSIGTVTKGDVAKVTIKGTSPNQILDFVLPKGDKGPKGNDGAVGPTGPIGPTGPQGPIGKGLTILGEKNNEGELPSSGNLGDGWLIKGNLYVWQGTKWLNVGNIKGPKGNDGQPGQQGPPGTPGAQGPPGPKGADGVAGPTGPTGPAGPTGPKGPKGNDGQPGTTDYNQLQNKPDLSIYQPKEAGKGLSSFDYNLDAKNKVDKIPLNAQYTDTTYSNATESAPGLMSPSDKSQLKRLPKQIVKMTEAAYNNFNPKDPEVLYLIEE